MKTINNILRITLKSTLLITVLIFLNVLVHAQDSGKTHVKQDSFSQSTFALVDNSVVDFKKAIVNSSTKKSTVLDFLQVETEEKLELENWMTNEEIFLVKTVQIETVKEDALNLEAWMTSKQFWKVK